MLLLSSPGGFPMPKTKRDRPAPNWTAAELRRLPPAERDAILAAAAERAEADYRRDRDLTDFEAFGEEDLYGDSSDARPR
jgi:hypothetical protein